MNPERVGEVVRVGLNVLGVLILIAVALYFGVQFYMALVQWAVKS